MFEPGDPPDPNAGSVSRATLKLRPSSGLSEEAERFARHLRRVHPEMSDAEIALRMGVEERQIALALMTLRTRHANPTRATINASRSAGTYVEDEALPGEPRWQTLDRLFVELDLRRMGIGPLTPGGV